MRNTGRGANVLGVNGMVMEGKEMGVKAMYGKRCKYVEKDGDGNEMEGKEKEEKKRREIKGTEG